MKTSRGIEPDAVRNFVENVWRPRVQADGGEMRFVSVDDQTVTVRMQGECSYCPLAGSRLKSFVEKELRDEFGQTMILQQIIDKPYFADK